MVGHPRKIISSRDRFGLYDYLVKRVFKRGPIIFNLTFLQIRFKEFPLEYRHVVSQGFVVPLRVLICFPPVLFLRGERAGESCPDSIMIAELTWGVDVTHKSRAVCFLLFCLFCLFFFCCFFVFVFLLYTAYGIYLQKI